MPHLDTNTDVTPKQRNTLRNILVSILLIFLLLGAALVVMFSTNAGSQFLLDRVLERQQIIRYEYEGGNLWQGLILRNVALNLAAVDVKIDRADVNLGWRAILNKEIHLSRADVQNLQIITKNPPSDEPFKFNPIRLPFVLRVDHVDLDHLLIETSSGTQVNFYDAIINDALWQDTKLEFADTNVSMGYLLVKNASGSIDFKDKYPLDVVALVNLPSLNNSLNIHDIQVVATGSLDSIQAGVATRNPDLLTGWVVVHPVRKNVPMFGALKFAQYQLPFLTEQKLFAEKGIAKFNGNAQGLGIDLNTDLTGKDIPKGQYTASMFTDFVNQIDIHALNGQVMQGAVNLAGVVSWKNQVTWDLQGRLDKINPKDPIIPQVVKDFLPPSLDAAIASKGTLENGLHLTADVDFDRDETWQLNLDQNPQQANKPQPLNLDIAWRDLDRAMPYVGWLSSQQGSAQISLLDAQQNIAVKTEIKQHEQSFLPTGQYQALLNIKNNILNIPQFNYQADTGGLNGTAVVELPDEKRQLKWRANLNAKDFNPQSLASALPVDRLNGQVLASGYALPNQQIIQLQNINLLGCLTQQSQTVRLSGKSTAAVLFHDEKAGGGFKGYAVNYEGDLDASDMLVSKGGLNFKIAGTPEFLNIQHFQHRGIAGNISANGQVNLANTLSWKINAALNQFKPQYFVAGVKGDISGQVTTQGIWTDKLKQIQLQQLKLTGQLNGKPLRGQGNLSVLLKNDHNGFVPSQFEANGLYLAYANNQLQATGNAQNLRLSIDAPALYELYPGLRGRIYGNLNVQAAPRLKATANLAVDDFGLNDSFSIKKMRLQGDLPTSTTTATQMRGTLLGLRAGGREIQQGEISLSGKYNAHVLKVQAQNRLSQFNVQLAGGFTANHDWLGQIQKGDFDSLRTHLVQRQHAAVVYNQARQELLVGAHCWVSQQSQLCADQPLRISPSKGNVSLITRNVNLDDFAAFMPEGLSITGLVNGYAKAAWAQGQQPKLDARLVTQDGSIGLAAEDPQYNASKINYKQVAVVAKSVSQGLKLRLDVTTQNSGEGYADVLIDPYSARKNISGDVAFKDIDLKIVKPFIQDVRSIGGHLSFAGKVKGALSAPQLNGDLRLKDGAISMISLPVNLTNIQLYSAIRQNQASINGAFNSGRGVGQLTGAIDWRNEPRIHLKLKGDDLLIRQAPLITAIVDPEISMDVLPAQRRISVNGEIYVPRALISMPEASAPVVNVSSDVRIVQDGQNQLAILRAAKPWDVRADVMVQLGDQVIFQGFDSRIPLLGRLYLSQRGLETAMRANGAIGVSKRVKIEAYGQSLDLNRAIARFNGPLANPSLDVEANKVVQGSTVGLRVTGNASSPNIQIYNDAGLSEQEALNALITGRINDGNSGISQTEGFKSDVNNTIAAAGISMGLGGTRALTNQIGRTIGLSGLALDAQGTGDDTQVSVTGYITPDLFIRYGVGVFTPVNKLTLRYQMNQRVYVEASQALERAVDVFYHWKF